MLSISDIVVASMLTSLGTSIVVLNKQSRILVASHALSPARSVFTGRRLVRTIRITLSLTSSRDPAILAWYRENPAAVQGNKHPVAAEYNHRHVLMIL